MTIERLSFRPSEAAGALNVSRTTVYELLRRRELTSFKIGSATLIAADELRRFIAAREAEARELGR